MLHILPLFRCLRLPAKSCSLFPPERAFCSINIYRFVNLYHGVSHVAGWHLNTSNLPPSWLSDRTIFARSIILTGQLCISFLSPCHGASSMWFPGAIWFFDATLSMCSVAKLGALSRCRFKLPLFPKPILGRYLQPKRGWYLLCLLQFPALVTVCSALRPSIHLFATSLLLHFCWFLCVQLSVACV